MSNDRRVITNIHATANNVMKLELCAAHLLPKYCKKYRKILGENISLHVRSNSAITLSQIKNYKKKENFFRNRVGEIMTKIPNAKGNHVNSKENPADVTSEDQHG